MPTLKECLNYEHTKRYIRNAFMSDECGDGSLTIDPENWPWKLFIRKSDGQVIPTGEQETKDCRKATTVEYDSFIQGLLARFGSGGYQGIEIIWDVISSYHQKWTPTQISEELVRLLGNDGRCRVVSQEDIDNAILIGWNPKEEQCRMSDTSINGRGYISLLSFIELYKLRPRRIDGKKLASKLSDKEERNHTRTMAHLANVGLAMGFVTDGEFYTSPCDRMDVIWRKSLGCGNSIEFGFEVVASKNMQKYDIQNINAFLHDSQSLAETIKTAVIVIAEKEKAHLLQLLEETDLKNRFDLLVWTREDVEKLSLGFMESKELLNVEMGFLNSDSYKGIAR